MGSTTPSRGQGPEGVGGGGASAVEGVGPVIHRSCAACGQLSKHLARQGKGEERGKGGEVEGGEGLHLVGAVIRGDSRHIEARRGVKACRWWSYHRILPLSAHSGRIGQSGKRPQGAKISAHPTYIPIQNICTKVHLYLAPCYCTDMSDSYTLIGKLLVKYITSAGNRPFFPPYI